MSNEQTLWAASRNLGVLQERQQVRRRNGLRLAKHMCETKSFCNMFRTPARATP